MSDDRNRIHRREALKLGALSAGALAPTNALLGPEPPPYALRTPVQGGEVRTVPPPPLPPLYVIAYNRLAFGQRVGDFAAFLALGSNDDERLTALVDQQLSPQTIDDSDAEARIAALNLTTLGKSLEELWADHVVANGDDYGYRMSPLYETRIATLVRAVYSRRQLFEVLVDFWHNHFNVLGNHYYVGPAFVHYDRDVIRAHALGNFREMLEAVAASTSMLYYLDNYINRAPFANENFARELFELHTIGSDHYLGVRDPFDVPKDENGVPVGYVDNDVYESARAFTGWRVDAGYGTNDTGTFFYDDTWHDRFNKFILGEYLPADQPPLKDGRDVLDLLASHPGTAHHIAKKLCRRLISDGPPPYVVEAAAAVFHANVGAPDQLKKVVRAIALSDAFRTTWARKVKRPFEVTASMLRAIDAEITPSDSFWWNYRQMGQTLFGRPSPDGYPDRKADWTGTTAMLHRWRLCSAMIEGWIDGINTNLVGETPATKRTPNDIADYWISRILGRSMHPAEDRDEIVEFLAQGGNPDYELPDGERSERIPRAVELVLMAPDFQYR